MPVPLLPSPSNGVLFEPSDVYYANPGSFDDFGLLNDLQQHQQMANLFSYGMPQEDGSNMDDSAFDEAESSPRDQPATSTSPDSELSNDHDVKLRRRAQNRASQRAFRERKDRHLRSLKVTLETLGGKHRTLIESYSQQSEAVMHLKGRIAELHGQIAALSMQAISEQQQQHGLRAPCQQQRPCAEFEQFDAFSFASRPPSSRHSNSIGWRDHGRASTEIAGMQLPPSQQLPGFEDLLNLS